MSSGVAQLNRSGAVTGTILGPGEYAHARLAPDGRRIAVAIGAVGKQDIWIYQIAGQTLSRLTSGGDNRSPEWMSDGRRVVYVSDRSGKAGVWMQAADHSSDPVLLVEGDGGLLEAVPSPDGRWLVCTTLRGASGVQLTTVSLDRKEVRPYVSDHAVTPRFSPDGRQVAYASAQSGRSEVSSGHFRALAARCRSRRTGAPSPSGRQTGTASRTSPITGWRRPRSAQVRP